MAQFEQFEGPDVFNQEPETVDECLAKIAAKYLKEQNDLNAERGRAESANTNKLYDALKALWTKYKLPDNPSASDILTLSNWDRIAYAAAYAAAQAADAARKAATATEFLGKQTSLDARKKADEALCRLLSDPNRPSPVPEPPVKPGSVAME